MMANLSDQFSKNIRALQKAVLHWPEFCAKMTLIYFDNYSLKPRSWNLQPDISTTTPSANHQTTSTAPSENTPCPCNNNNDSSDCATMTPCNNNNPSD